MTGYISAEADAPQFIDGSGVANPVVKFQFIRGTNEPLLLQFLTGPNSDVPKKLPDGSTIRLMLKPPGKFDSTTPYASAIGSAWTAPTTDEGYYTATLDCNTTPLNTAFHTPDGDDTNDLATLLVMLVLTWTLPGETNPHATIYLDQCVCYNMGDTGAEGTPTGGIAGFESRIAALEAASASNRDQYLPSVIDYTGGGATKLDGVTTAGLTLPYLFHFVHLTDGLRWFQLRAGTDSPVSGTIVRPADYNASTNARQFYTT